jgi:hypothetical protein
MTDAREYHFVFTAWLIMAGVLSPLRADDPGVVSHVKVLSNNIEDVSSLAAWKESFIKQGMSDEEKALAIWETMVKFRHTDAPPWEFLQTEPHVHDPIKTFNVYGHGNCCCASCSIEALARYIGFQARGWGIRGHSVPEVSWDNKSWHMLDASYMTYYRKADGRIASVEELVTGVRDWYEKNPGYQNNDANLRRLMRDGGWRKGPDVFGRCQFYDDNGRSTFDTHLWNEIMRHYDCKPYVYEYGYSQGYQVNMQLRKGERLTRNWFNKGLHVNMDGSYYAPACLKGVVGMGNLRYSRDHGDLAPGRVGNGILSYDAPLADPAFRRSVLAFDNLAVSPEKKPAAVFVEDKDRPGTLVVRMPSSYVYLTGEATLQAVVGPGGRITLAFSDNNGLDWKDITTLDASGEKTLDLKPYVFRRYDYRLKLTLQGAGTGLNRLQIAHDFQHSQRPLPALVRGKNAITLHVGPQEGTVTVEGSTHFKARGKQLLYTDFRPQVESMTDNPMRVGGKKGQMTFPVATPGDMVRLRFGCHYRAKDEKDGWDLQVSFDGGKTFQTVDRAGGPVVGSCKYVTFADIPAHTKEALVRFAGSQHRETCLFDFRIDADYRQPNGSFRPINVTYRWEENGLAKEDQHVARQPGDRYSITCAGNPTMKSISLEWAE